MPQRRIPMRGRSIVFINQYSAIMFKRIFLSCLVAISLSAFAQGNFLEHNIYAGVGVSNTFESGDKQNTALRLGYGLNCNFSSHWSVMPGVELRLKTLGYGEDGAGSYTAVHTGIPLLMQYHFSGSQRQGVMVECGPVFSFLIYGEEYAFDPYLKNPLDGKKEYKNFDLGLRPGVYYESNHWRFGVHSHIGLLNSKREYTPFVTDSYHAFDITAVVNFYW